MTEIPIPIEVKALPDFKIWVRYADGISGKIDLNHLRNLPAFKVWNEDGAFEKVFVADRGRCIAWNDVLELCPNALYLDVINKTYEEYATH